MLKGFLENVDEKLTDGEYRHLLSYKKSPDEDHTLAFLSIYNIDAVNLVRAYCKNLGINSLPRDFSPSGRERFIVSHRKLFTLNSVRKISYSRFSKMAAMSLVYSIFRPLNHIFQYVNGIPML